MREKFFGSSHVLHCINGTRSKRGSDCIHSAWNNLLFLPEAFWTPTPLLLSYTPSRFGHREAPFCVFVWKRGLGMSCACCVKGYKLHSTDETYLETGLNWWRSLPRYREATIATTKATSMTPLGLGLLLSVRHIEGIRMLESPALVEVAGFFLRMKIPQRDRCSRCDTTIIAGGSVDQTRDR